MDIGKLRLGEWLAAVSAAALLVVTFLVWFGRDGGASQTAWQAFAVLDLVLVVFAVLGVGVAVLAASRRSPAAPVAAAVVTAAVGIVLTIVLLFRLAFPPGPNELVELRYGAVLGLLCVIGVTAGAWYVMRDERTDAIEPPFIPAQPVPPATAPAGSRVAEGRAPEPEDRS